MKVKYYSLIALFLISIQLNAQKVDKLKSTLISKFSSGDFSSANISLSVIDFSNGNEVIGHRSRKNLVPASSLKLFTTLTSLNVLKPTFTFKTTIGYSGKISNDGTLIGDIIVRGSGDPTLGSNRINNTPSYDEIFLQFSKAILNAGITCVNGNILIDASVFDNYPAAPSWQWNDLGNYYASGAWGLNINENLYYLAFDNNGKIGDTPRLRSISPAVNNLKFSNELKINGPNTGDQAYIFGGPNNFNKRVIGTIPQGNGDFSIKGSIPNPPLFFAEKLKSYLEELNIQVQSLEVKHEQTQSNIKTLSSVESPQVKEIIKKANFDSQNLYAESLLKIMGYVKKGQGCNQNGIAEIENQLKKYKINTSEYILYDGSGLSARNNISSRAMSSFLFQFGKEMGMELATTYLPRGAYEGTVKHMFKSSAAKGKIWLKSGSMEGVQSYSGYIKSKDNNWYSFAFIVNGFTVKGRSMRAQMEKILTEIYLAL